VKKYDSIARAWEDAKFDQYSKEIESNIDDSDLASEIRELAFKLKEKSIFAEEIGLTVDYESILDYLESEDLSEDDVRISREF
jgi:hypothetical protein